jgi:hypothetical protein
MRRFLLLAAILALTWAVIRQGAAFAPLPGYVLRDALLLLLLLAAAGAWAARPIPPRRTTEHAWTNAGQAFFGAGALTALLGALLPRMAPTAATYALIVWGVGLALSLLGLLLRGGVVRYAPPTVRWARDDNGRIVGKPLTEEDANGAPNTLGRRGAIVLALLLAAAIALRVGLALRLPAYCQGSECDLLLATTSEATRTTLLLQPLAIWLRSWTSDPLLALRLATALLSSLALLALVPALRRLVSPGGVLLGVALAGFGAWAAAPATEATLFTPLVVWGAAAAINGGGARGWAAAGLALGLTAVAAPALLGAWLLWLLLLLVVALSQPERARWVDMAVLLLGALAGAALLAAPLAFTSRLGPLLPGLMPTSTQLVQNASALFITLFAPGAGWLGALALVGAGAAMRSGRRGAVLLSGNAALLLWLLFTGEAAQWPLLVPFFVLLAALAADQLLQAALLSSKPLLRARAVTAAALAITLLVILPGLWRTAAAPQAQTDTAGSEMARAVAAYITGARTQADQAGERPRWLVPATLLDQPALQTAIAPEIQAGEVRGYNLQSGLPYAGSAPGGIVYLLAVDDAATRDELWRVYPTGVAAPADIDPSLPALTSFTVSGADLAASRGLLQLVASAAAGGDTTAGASGATASTANNANLSAGVGPLDFGWAAYPPAPPPFAAEWRGSLLVPNQGEYAFGVESSPGALFTLLLDGQLMLDTSAALTRTSDILPAGAYAVTMRYQSGSTPGDLRVLWQPPGLDPEPIPLEALHNPVIPTLGLVGTYTAGALWDGPILALRKDRVIDADPTLRTPWSVRWQGQLAAPRAGEYLIGAVSDGAVLIEVDGQPVVTQFTQDDPPAGGYGPAEGTIYLPGGWTPITVRYATGNVAGRTPEIKLYWQPPGSGPAPLNVAYLHPSTIALSPADVPLPSLPPVLDARLGDDRFALSGETAYWLPQTRIPARNLPPLNLERVAAFGLCGPDLSQLNAPHGLAWDATGQRLYVADTGNRRVLALDVNETVLLPEELLLPTLEEPVDVAVAADGTLYVLDTAAPQLIAYNPATAAANIIALGEGFYRPRGLDVDETGLLHIADTGGARVAVAALEAEGEGMRVAVQGQFGGPGTPLGNGQPVDVAAAPQAIWALAAEEGRLWRMDGFGSITAIRPTNTINGPHLAHLADGRLVVSDPARALVLLFSAQGEPLAALGDAGAFLQPTGVATWEEEGDLLLAVSDSAACEVSLWRGRMP